MAFVLRVVAIITHGPTGMRICVFVCLSGAAMLEAAPFLANITAAAMMLGLAQILWLDWASKYLCLISASGFPPYSQVVLPHLCFDDQDAELWEEDPQEFVRKVRGKHVVDVHTQAGWCSLVLAAFCMCGAVCSVRVLLSLCM